MNSLFDTDHLYKTYFKLSLPMALGLMVSLIYNLADTYFVALTGNTNLIAGVSLCAPLFTALMAFGNIFGQGGSSLISRMLGRNYTDGTHRVSSFSFYGGLITGVVIGVFCLIVKTPLLHAFGATEETMSYANEYYTALSIGSPLIVLAFVHSNIIRCEGRSTDAMIATILGAVINIVLDPLFIFTFGMGAKGAAIATVIGYTGNTAYSFYTACKKCHSLSVNPKDCKVNKNELASILGVGVTAALSNIMQSLTTAINNQYLLPYGNDKIATLGIVLKVTSIPLMVITGFAFGGIPLFGYLYGAKDKKNLFKLIRFNVIFLSSIGIVLSAVIMVFAKQFIGLFLKDESLVSSGIYMLRLQAITTVLVALIMFFTVFFQALGKVIPAFILSISRQGVVFVVAIVICSNLFGYTGVVMSQAVADVISTIIAVLLLVFFNPLKGLNNTTENK